MLNFLRKKLILYIIVVLATTLFMISYFKGVANQTTETENPITSRAILIFGNETKTLSAIANEYERIYVKAGQAIQIRLDENYFLKDQSIILETNNGGNLNGKIQPRQVLPVGSSLSFTFTAGIHPGLYTVKVKQANRRELFEFWVGAERPIGAAGPDRFFVSPEERK